MPKMYKMGAQPLVTDPIGTWIDGWQVVWCEPDRNCILWYLMLLRPEIEFRGCCATIDTD